MPDPTKLSALTELAAAPASGDHLYIDDISEVNADAPKRITIANALSFYDSVAATLTNKTFDANGTGNSLSNVDVADLANGTDGELITWDALGAPATVAVGTSGNILTSNGAGAAPTFQAAGAADNLGDHTATQDLAMATFDIDDGGVIFLNEQAEANADVAGDGQIWVNTATPNELFFTDDAGTDGQVVLPANTITFTNKTFDANGTGNSITNIDLTADVINDLPVAEGGTGVSTLTDGGVLLGSGAGAITAMAVLADGEIIVGDGVGDPVAESGATARTSLGLAIGTDVQAFGAVLDDLNTTGVVGADSEFLVGTAAGAMAWEAAATALISIGGIGAATTDTLTNKTLDANGTGNSLSNVDVADLANGTDGELITWDALGAPATVAVGTSGNILTSNGAGAAPTFQAAGAADNLGDHTATQDLAMATFDIDDGGVIFLNEQAEANADVAGDGQIWVNTATPNELFFTDDAGTDGQVVLPANTITFTNKTFDANGTGNSITNIGASEIEIGIITGHTELSTGPAETDEVLISDAGVFKKINVVELLNPENFTAVTLPAAADELFINDAGVGKKITHDDLLFGANGTPSTQAHSDAAAIGTALDAARSDHKHAMPAGGAGTDISCRLTHSTTQSISNNSFTDLAFDGEDYDTDGMHDNVTNNDRITIQTAGKYVVYGSWEMASNGTGRRIIRLTVNSARVAGLDVGPSTIAHDMNLSAEVNLAANDIVRLHAYQNSGGALNVNSTSDISPRFGVMKVLG